MKESKVTVRPMQETDLDKADAIMRIAFGTYLGLPEPITFMGDADFVKTRFATDPSAAIAAEIDDKLVGSNFLLHWGSVGVFGPLTVHPEYWDRGIARKLLEETMQIFQRWGTAHIGLFTFAQSSKHVHLYQKFGFWPRFLTVVMSKQITHDRTNGVHYSLYSTLNDAEKKAVVEECAALTSGIYQGLDLQKEIRAVDRQKLGDTLLMKGAKNDESAMEAFAICHAGAGTEAGSGNCYVKFAAVNPTSNSAKAFDSLLDACEHFANSKKLLRLTAGANAGRHKQYERMMERGFRTEMQGVAMHHPDEPGYNRQDVWLIDDWR